MHPISLLILAGGWGSRYGGLKQIHGFGPNGESLLDYAVFDALNAGFNKLYLLVNKEIKHFAEQKISHYPFNQLECKIILQDINDTPLKIKNLKRIKPWGTAHALYACRQHIKEPFALINADDFYGHESFINLYKFLKDLGADDKNFCLQGFKLKNTVPNQGEVSRGICKVNADFYLTDIKEIVGLKKTASGKITDRKGSVYKPDTMVSMNCWGLTPMIFKLLAEDFKEFLTGASDLINDEFMLPNVIKDLTFKGFKIKTIPSEYRVIGITNRTDKIFVQEYLKTLHLNKTYPHSLKKDDFANDNQKQESAPGSLRRNILL